MATNTDEPQRDDDSWLYGSPTYRLALRLGLANPTRPRRTLRILLLVLVTWVPLVLLSLAAGTALGGRVDLPLLRDPEIFIRFLFVVPLLELAEFIVSKSITVQVRHLVASGLVPERELPAFDSVKNEVARLRRSVLAEGTMIVLSFALPIVMRVFVGFDVRPSSWERLGEVITSAGWWYILVSLPVLFFFLLRWCWVFLLWSRFLFRVSRMDLDLTPTHPDRAGGLGFIGWGLASNMEHAAIDEETILDQREYHTITEVKNGLGPAPIKTEKGWLHLAHGVRNTAAGLRYVLYCFLCDLKRPYKVIAKPGGYFLAPEGEERIGDVSNVAFSNGWVRRGDEVLIYYGASDTRTYVAGTTVDRLLDYVLHTPPDPLRSAACVRQRIALIDKNKGLLKR